MLSPLVLAPSLRLNTDDRETLATLIAEEGLYKLLLNLAQLADTRADELADGDWRDETAEDLVRDARLIAALAAELRTRPRVIGPGEPLRIADHLYGALADDLEPLVVLEDEPARRVKAEVLRTRLTRVLRLLGGVDEARRRRLEEQRLRLQRREGSRGTGSPASTGGPCSAAPRSAAPGTGAR